MGAKLDLAVRAKLDLAVRAFVLAGLSLAGLLGATPGSADTAAAGDQAQGGLEEITVTARKRVESEMSTPVVIDVVSAQRIKDLKIADLYDFASVTPGFRIDEGFGQVGTVVFLRGIGSGDLGTYIDQSVGLNIDGIGVSQGVFYKSGSFDMGQIELLKGPQGMFYGKSTTAGVVAIHTADPTPQWESAISGGYEVNAKEWLANGYVSGPITDKLGIRIAGVYDQMAGWLINPNPMSSVHRLGDENYGGRITLTWDDPDTGFRAKLKAAGTHDFTDASANADTQAFYCPYGKRQQIYELYDNCKLDNYTQGYGPAPPYNPNFDWLHSLGNPAPFAAGSYSPLFRDGEGYAEMTTAMGMLQMDYDITPALTATSVTGYEYAHTQENSGNSAFGEGASTTLFQVAGDFAEADYSEELRLTSNWTNSWFNFMVGGLYDSTSNNLATPTNTPAYTIWGQSDLYQTGRTSSAFGQIMLTPIDKWELDLGIRYTQVHKYFTGIYVYNNYSVLVPQPLQTNLVPTFPYDMTNVSERNASPESTLTYRPTDNWTLFASYKRGYKGPGFNASDFDLGTPTSVSPFGGEKVKGGEAGAKAILLDRHLQLTAAVYDYDYIGLQVTNFDNLTHTTLITNAANANTRGMELSANYQPAQIERLQLNAAVNYNEGKFTSFPTSPCYSGQAAVPGLGCTEVDGNFTQDLTGHRLYQAPEWTGTVGVAYTLPLTDSYSARLIENTNFSSGYFTIPDELPGGWQKGYVTFDATLRFGKLDGPWEVALIGRNLSNKLYVNNGLDQGTPTQLGDAVGYANRPRQIMLQVTARPMLFRN
jgi:iron complex outermembrane recepter protein